MTARMYRYEVPADDQAHLIDLCSDPVAAAAVYTSPLPPEISVEFWAEANDTVRFTSRAFQVFGTGHRLPEGAVWRATCPRMSNGLVFHLYELGVS